MTGPASPRPVLHLFCGKIASGKSTLARGIATAPGHVLISEDAWLGALFGDRMASVADYMQYAAVLRGVMGPHVTDLLRAGLSVVLDYPANTPGQRAWMKTLLNDSDAGHRLHVFDLPDAICLARLKARQDAGAHPFTVTEDQFHRVTAHLVMPSGDEGFDIVRHGADA